MRVREAIPILCMACAAPAPAPRPDEARVPPRGRRVDPVVARVHALLDGGDIAGARALLERERWYADDRARTALLLCGCLLVQGEFAAGIEVVRDYLAKTPRLRTERDRLAARLLRHHATGGGLRAESAEEACYFGLYALGALQEPATARPDLERALAAAPPPERALVRAAWSG